MGKGKAKKSSWKKINLQAEEDLPVKNRIQAKLDKAELDGDLFTIDTAAPDIGIRKKREKVKHTDFGKEKAVMVVKPKAKVERAVPKQPRVRDPNKKQKPPLMEEPVIDIWAGDLPKEDIAPHEERRRPKKVPKTLLKGPESLAPAVILPQNGQAINPDEEEYKTTLFQAAAVEVQREERLKEALNSMAPMTQHLLTKYSEQEIAAMSDAEKVAAYQEMTGMSQAALAPPAEPADPRQLEAKDRYSDVQRNKVLRRKFLDRTQKEKAKERQFEKQFRGIDHFIGDIATSKKIKANEKKLAQARLEAKMEAERKGEDVRPKKLGKNRFKEVPMAVAVADDVVGSSLRAAHLDGNSTSEIAASIYRRNKLEAPMPLDKGALSRAKHKRYKYQKWNTMADPNMRTSDRVQLGA